MSVLTKIFKPSGRKFYVLFDEVAGNLSTMSMLFIELLSTEESAKRKKLLDEIERMENKNDNVSHDLFVELVRNYITPFDREDIHTLVSSLDDIADYIWGTSKQMYLFNIHMHDNTSKNVATELLSFSKNLSSAITGLQSRQSLKELTTTLADLRKHTSKIDHFISEGRNGILTTKSEDTIEIIKLSDHYSMLQQLNDKCSEVTNVLENTIIKYA